MGSLGGGLRDAGGRKADLGLGGPGAGNFGDRRLFTGWSSGSPVSEIFWPGAHTHTRSLPKGRVVERNTELVEGGEERIAVDHEMGDVPLIRVEANAVGSFGVTG